MGKMISPQNLSVGAAGVGAVGREGEILAKVIMHSLILTALMGVAGHAAGVRRAVDGAQTLMSRRWRWLAFGVAAGRARPSSNGCARCGVRKEPGAGSRRPQPGDWLLAGATTAASEWPVVAPVQAPGRNGGRLGLLRWLPLPQGAAGRRRLPAARLHAVSLASPESPRAVPVAVSCGAPHRSRSRQHHRPAVPLRRALDGGGLQGGAGAAAGRRSRDPAAVAADAVRVRSSFTTATWRCPSTPERSLVPFLVTPRMHGIHHSTRSEDDRLELFEPVVVLGSVAPEPAVERRAGVGHDRGRRLFGARGRDAGGLADAAVRAGRPC